MLLKGLRNAMALPDLRRKLLYTLLILVIYRLASHVPVPGVDQEQLRGLLGGGGGGAQDYLNLLNMLSGGAVARFSVLANGVYPYITASIIFQLLLPIFPRLEKMYEEGEAGRRKLNQWQYYITVPLALLQSYGQVQTFNAASTTGPVLPNFGFGEPQNVLPTISVLLTMMAGTMFAIWLGELITEQGVGNGLSIIIFGGIVAGAPSSIGRVWVMTEPTQGAGVASLVLGITVAIMALTMLVIVIVQEGERRIPVQYGKRVRGIKTYTIGGRHIPLKINTAGMIPLIFAQSFLTFPAMIASFLINSSNQSIANGAEWVRDFFTPQNPWYGLIYFLAVVGFTYFYTDIMIQQQDLPGALQKQGGFIPGVRPGKRTADYINNIYRRITLVGALFLGGVAVLPFLVELGMEALFGVRADLLITSSGLLIVVGVVLDTMRQLEAQLLMRHYEGFIK